MKEFHINSYRLQYWLYAVLNAEFGTEVTFQRDNLHHMYEANRHSFYVLPNTMTAKKVREGLIKKLLAAGYQADKEYNSDNSHFTKVTQRKTGVERLHVSVQECAPFMGRDKKPRVSVYAHAYWR